MLIFSVVYERENNYYQIKNLAKITNNKEKKSNKNKRNKNKIKQTIGIGKIKNKKFEFCLIYDIYVFANGF